mmetsp:Transcript_13612/g.15260  ORF Transcript_13612/g.15260 Transcript_13612/m.15260 type:complete len:187 (-) Transcript_13612:386-946(-)
MDNTDYDEEREVNIIANRKLRGSVMNIALPSNLEENKKKSEGTRSEGGKRKRSEVDIYIKEENQREQSLDNIRRAFEEHSNSNVNLSTNNVVKRVKTSEKEERSITPVINGEGEEKPCSESTVVTTGNKQKEKEEEENPLRKLSISNFEPVQPKNKLSSSKDNQATHGTPQPNRTDNMIINQLVYK